MLELAILAVLVSAVVLAIRFNRPALPENPVIVQQCGRYHITLAPQLDFALEFLETLAKRLDEACQSDGDISTRYFQVHYDDSAKQSGGFYLLAVAYRKGIYFLQAIAPLPLLHDTDSHLNSLRLFSDTVLLHYPLTSPVDAGNTERMDALIKEVGQQSGLGISNMV